MLRFFSIHKMELPGDMNLEIAQKATTAELVSWCNQNHAVRKLCERSIWYQKAIAVKNFDESKMPVVPPGQTDPYRSAITSNQAYYFLAVALFDYDPVASPLLVQPFYIAWRAIISGDLDLFERYAGINDYSSWLLMYRRWSWLRTQKITLIRAEEVEAFYSKPITEDDMAEFKKFLSERRLREGSLSYYSDIIAQNAREYPGYITTNPQQTTRTSVLISYLLSQDKLDAAIKFAAKTGNLSLNIFGIYAKDLPLKFITSLIEQKVLNVDSLFKCIDTYNLWHWFVEPLIKELFISQGRQYNWTSPIAKRLL